MLDALSWPEPHIWRANQPDGDNGGIINLDDGDVRLLVFRRDDRVVITEIEKSAYAFLEGIAHGAQLEEAIRAARQISPSFDSAADAAGGASIKRSSSVEPFAPTRDFIHRGGTP